MAEGQDPGDVNVCVCVSSTHVECTMGKTAKAVRGNAERLREVLVMHT